MTTETQKDIKTLTNEELLAQYKGEPIMSEKMIELSSEIHRRATEVTGDTYEIITDAINVLTNGAKVAERAKLVTEICRSYIARADAAEDAFMTYANESGFVSAVESRAELMIATQVSAVEASTILSELRKDQKNCVENLAGYIKAEREYFTRRGVRIAASTNLWRNVSENTKLEARARTLFDSGELYCEIENALASVA